MHIKYFNECSEWAVAVISQIATLAEAAIRANGQFNIVLTGGNTPEMLYQQLKGINTEWSFWNFWISDERMPVGGFSSFNSDMIFSYLLNYIPITMEQVHFISLTTDFRIAVNSYIDELTGKGIFDLTLLGVGEDGHTASLFPGNDWGLSPDSPDVMLVNNSPKFPPLRISLSGNRLCRSKEIIYIARGGNKLNIIRKIRNREELPLNSVHGINNTTLYYCIDD